MDTQYETEAPLRNGAGTARDVKSARVAVISSPRSGNTWLRHLLATLHGLEHRPVYNPLALDWEGLPSRCALMTHWQPSEPLVSLLERHRFRVVTLVRHPLDVVLSILHYAPHHPETWRWLDGEGGDERSIVGATPGSRRFLDYATGARARALLAISHAWSRMPGVVRVRYEDLVGNTPETLAGIAGALGLGMRIPLAEAIAAHTLERLRVREGPHHWQGRPGLWRELLLARDARRIAASYEALFRDHRYACVPDEGLDGERADGRWHELALRRGQDGGAHPAGNGPDVGTQEDAGTGGRR